MVYLIHLEKPLAHARHYIGFTPGSGKRVLNKRMTKHKNGTGSKFLAAVNRAGIDWHVARTWEEGDRTFERQLKNRKKSSCLCPECIAGKKTVINNDTTISKANSTAN
jgi:predicted GIY-YIG superfamily endonuclease